MQTRIVSAFPGTGKTYYHKLHPETTLDSDSSQFSWIEIPTKMRNPDFPGNYIQHIKDNISKYEFIFVSSHKEVRDALLNNCLFFYLVYPSENRKEEFVKRFKDRGSSDSFIQLVSYNWKQWLRELNFCNRGCQQVKMDFPNLENELEHIVASEGGDI